MATQLQLRRGTTEENDVFVGAAGETTVDLDRKELRVHDGSTQGGFSIARSDLSNLPDTAKNISTWSSNITNCITEIPQDIKLELNSGVLTLKAGSKVYVPNGYTSSTPSATNWSQATQNIDSDTYWSSITYDGTKFIAIGYKYNSGIGQYYIVTSTSTDDGVSWSPLTLSFTPNNTIGFFWKISTNGTNYIALSGPGYISTSANGINWGAPTQNNNLGNNSWNSIIHDGTRYVALSGTGYTSTSADGSTWEVATQNSNLGDNTWISIIYDGTKYVALSRTGYISTSTDGTNWEIATQNSNLGNNAWVSIIYDGTKYVALNESGLISTSTNGTNWEAPAQNGNLSITSSYWRGVASNGTKFVALSSYSYTAISYPILNQLIFDEITIASDLSTTDTGSPTFVFYDVDSQVLRVRDITNSGTSDPQTPGTAYYDTENNIINYYTMAGVRSTAAFPICIITGQNIGGVDTTVSIDQVFNGFGYIGSTVFALPGVKGLIPDGRNTDGTLKNMPVTVSSVKTLTIADTSRSDIWVFLTDIGMTAWGASNGNVREYKTRPASAPQTYVRAYIEDENHWIHCWNSTTWGTIDSNDNLVKLFSVNSDANAKITGIFSWDTPFHAVNYNNTEFIAHQAAPSDTYVQLTFGASGTNYTAPADGYFSLNCQVKSDWLCIANNTTGIKLFHWAQNGENEAGLILPIEKGGVMNLNYANNENYVANWNTGLRFVYANGSM